MSVLKLWEGATLLFPFKGRVAASQGFVRIISYPAMISACEKNQ